MSDTVAERVALPTVYDWQARAIEDAAKLVAYWAHTTPEEKLAWQPKAEGQDSQARCIYDQLRECAQVNRRFASILSGVDPGPWQATDLPYASSAEAEADLISSAQELGDVIRTLDDGALTREYTTARGSMTGAFAITLALNNMHYHGGQINLIQVLLGDKEFHYPED